MMTAGQFFLYLLIIIILKESLASAASWPASEESPASPSSCCGGGGGGGFASELRQTEESSPVVTMGATCESPLHAQHGHTFVKGRSACFAQGECLMIPRVGKHVIRHSTLGNDNHMWETSLLQHMELFLTR